MKNHYVYYPPWQPTEYSLKNRWMAGDKPMSKHFTDTENTGAPLVPMVEHRDDIATDGGRKSAREETVLSHRLQE